MTIDRQFMRRHVSFIVIGCIAIVLALLVGPRALVPSAGSAVDELADESSMLGPPVPTTLPELVNEAQIVVIARVGPILREGFFAGYDQDGKMIPVDAKLAEEPGVGALPFVDYELQIERAFKDNGLIGAGQPLIIRLPGDRTRGMPRFGNALMPTTGDRYLFFLGPNPDNTTYGSYYGAWGRVVIDTPTVTASDVRHTPMFNRNTAPANFIQAVEQVIRNGR